MTAKELFEWCKEHKCEDYDLVTLNAFHTVNVEPEEDDIVHEDRILVL